MGMVIGSFAVILVLLLAFFAVSQVQKSRQVQREMKQLDKQMQKMQKSSAELEEQLEKAREELGKKKEELEEKEAELEKIQSEAEMTRVQGTEEQDVKNQDTQNQTEKKGQTVKNGKVVALDPGHQSYEITADGTEPVGPGSSEMKAKYATGTEGSFTGVPEYQLNMDISNQLKEELERRGYQVVMTRESNEVAISNVERAVLANESGADILVRIHANGLYDSSADGALTMVPSSENPYVANLSEDSYRLGENIINAYCTATGLRNRGVQYFDDMTGINWSQIPVTIVEMGFMTNQGDDEKMQNPDFQKKMVMGIAEGIDGYFEGT